MKSTVLFSLALSLQVTFVSAQSTKDSTAVMKVINDLFIAMKTNDSTLAGRLFTDEAQLFTILQEEQEGYELRKASAQRLVEAFARPKDQIWSEPIWNPRIEIADGLASVWVDYAFYIDKQMSHCGVDAFHLIQTNDGWKIFHLADTRRTSNCEVPDNIKKVYTQ